MTMPKFLFVYRSLPGQYSEAPSPEEIQALMASWGEWFRKVGEAVVDGGDGLQPTGRMVSSSGQVSDGPFIEAKELVGGFSILKAASYEQAVEFAKSCPILAGGGSIEIREFAGFN